MVHDLEDRAAVEAVPNVVERLEVRPLLGRVQEAVTGEHLSEPIGL